MKVTGEVGLERPSGLAGRKCLEVMTAKVGRKEVISPMEETEDMKGAWDSQETITVEDFANQR